MSSYVPPLKPIGFVLHELLGAADVLSQLPEYAGVDRELIDQLVAEAGSFAAKMVAPTRIASDAGYKLVDGRVLAPPGYVESYRAFVEAGWAALACKAEHGGQGLPMLLHNVMLEMLNSANPAWAMFPGIQHGAYDCLRTHASAALQQVYLPKIASGEWTTSMCLTEAQAGSDLGLVRSRAEPDADVDVDIEGAYRISGSKIFISGGDHDVAENIVHLVLARLPDAPAGTRGLSLFLVPHRLPADGDLQSGLNGVAVVGLEHKMGMRGSATCALAFENARGWLVGKANSGLQCMFVMMNAARLGVGMQALGTSELAYQSSLVYARERLQGRAAGSASTLPLIAHADVRRMLLTQKAWTDGARLLTYWLSLQLDIAHAHPDEAQRVAADSCLSLLTPVAKAFLSDNALEVAHIAVQIHGGHGYMSEQGVEQMVRDTRVFSIYEGTNGIQAQDLLGRKVLGDGGKALADLLDTMRGSIARLHSAEIAPMAAQWKLCVDSLRAALERIEPQHANAVAAHFLRAFGHVVMGWRFIEATERAVVLGESGLLVSARFYFDQLFGEASYRLQALSGGALVTELDEAVFG